MRTKMSISSVINERESNVISKAAAGKVIYIGWNHNHIKILLGNKQNDKSSDVVDEKSLTKIKYSLFVAKFDYLSRTEEELGFVIGELLYVIDTDDEDWWLAIEIHLIMKEIYPVIMARCTIRITGTQ